MKNGWCSQRHQNDPVFEGVSICRCSETEGAAFLTCSQELRWHQERPRVTFLQTRATVKPSFGWLLQARCIKKKKRLGPTIMWQDQQKQSETDTFTQQAQQRTLGQQNVWHHSATQHKQTQHNPQAILEPPDCQGHFGMLCVNAARHPCPFFLRCPPWTLSFGLVNLTLRVTVLLQHRALHHRGITNVTIVQSNRTVLIRDLFYHSIIILLLTIRDLS